MGPEKKGRSAELGKRVDRARHQLGVCAGRRTGGNARWHLPELPEIGCDAAKRSHRRPGIPDKSTIVWIQGAFELGDAPGQRVGPGAGLIERLPRHAQVRANIRGLVNIHVLWSSALPKL